MGSNQSKANSTLPPNYVTLYPQNNQLNYAPNLQPPMNFAPTLQPAVTVSTPANATAMQQLKDYVKAQVKAENLKRAGTQGADPWGNADELVPPTGAMHTYPNGYATLGTSAAAVAGQEPAERVAVEPTLPAFLTQPLTLLNKGSANGGPQALNYEVVYYAPVQESVTHREFINCFEDCCEDVCENCFLNCCLDCSRVSRLFSIFSRTNETTGQTEYMVMEAAAAAQAATDPYAATAAHTATTTIGNFAN